MTKEPLLSQGAIEGQFVAPGALTTEVASSS